MFLLRARRSSSLGTHSQYPSTGDADKSVYQLCDSGPRPELDSNAVHEISASAHDSKNALGQNARYELHGDSAGAREKLGNNTCYDKLVLVKY
jgi:hypothetical protein